MMPLIIGHSHIDCIRKAAEASGVAATFISLWESPYREASPEMHVSVPGVVREKLEPLVISMVGGAAHDLIGMVEHPESFDFVLPQEPELPLTPGARLLPYDVIRAAIKARMTRAEIALPSLIAEIGCRVIHIEPPPPLADNEVLQRELGVMVVLWNLPREAADRPASPWLRYKLWRAYSGILQEAFATRGVEFSNVPPTTLVEGRFLRPDLYSYPGHANEAYGALLLRQLGLLQ